MIYSIREKVTSRQIGEMLEAYTHMIKIVVDIRRKLLAGGGEMHADCESVLLENGSERRACSRDDLWGAN